MGRHKRTGEIQWEWGQGREETGERRKGREGKREGMEGRREGSREGREWRENLAPMVISEVSSYARKAVFNAKWLFKVIHVNCFDANDKPLGDYIVRHNNFGLMCEISKDID